MKFVEADLDQKPPKPEPDQSPEEQANVCSYCGEKVDRLTENGMCPQCTYHLSAGLF